MTTNTPSPPPEQPDHGSDQNVDLKRAELLLVNGAFGKAHGVMRWGSNYAELVTIADEDLVATAVYKPRRGERPLWDFPHGTLCNREAASYVLSEALGWHMVPPTVLRDGPHGPGSVQLFIDHDPAVNYFTLDDVYMDQLRRFAVFDFLANNADRKGGHLLLDADGRLWGIDHGLTFDCAPKLRTVIWEFAGQPLPDALVAGVARVATMLSTPDDPIGHKLAALLTEAEITALRRRMQHLIQCPEFPEPGPGPNHPWPPV